MSNCFVWTFGMVSRKLRLFICLTCLLLVGGAPRLEAATITWTDNARDRNWFTGGNWNGGVPPRIALDTVTIGTRYTVNLPDNSGETGAYTLNIQGTLNVYIKGDKTNFNTLHQSGTINYYPKTYLSLSTLNQTGPSNFFVIPNELTPLPYVVFGNRANFTNEPLYTVTPYGFSLWDTAAVQQLCKFTLSINGNIAVNAPFQAEIDTDKVGFSFDQDTLPAWDMKAEILFDPLSDESRDGWLLVGDYADPTRWSSAPTPSGTEKTVRARFSFSSLTDTTAQAFLDYLQSAMPGGYFLEPSEYFASDGTAILTFGDEYNVLSWGLTAFNAEHGTDIRLHSLAPMGIIETPEPATWLMLLLGGVLLVCVRRKRR